MAYATINKPEGHFDVKTFTGTGYSNAITGMELQPDWVWIKNRESALSHVLVDSSRGVNKYLKADADTDETTDSNSITAFGSEGFTVGSLDNVNKNTEEHVAWCWKANGATTWSNTSGTITSTVQANTTAGFSIATYTGTGSNATIGHGLGAIPKFLIIKRRSSAENWAVYHGSTIITSDPQTDYYELSTNAGTADNALSWNDTAPTSTLFSIGTGAWVNADTSTYVAYCFTPIKGYSHFGAYTGVSNNADGPMIYTGFRPKFIIVKRSNGAESWLMQDTERTKIVKDGTVGNNGNPVEQKLIAQDTTAENSTSPDCDFYATGFKPRSTDGIHNWTDYQYIYMAFADMPLVASNGVVALSR